MIVDGRQYAESLSGIRDDHIERYKAASALIYRYGAVTVVDAGCGIGYGSALMAMTGAKVHGFDASESAITFGREHYPGDLHVGTLLEHDCPAADLLTMFEIIEHTHDAPAFLTKAAGMFNRVICSVPNELVCPFNAPTTHADHVRHYTPEEFTGLLTDCGWHVTHKGSQQGKTGAEAAVNWGTTTGRTLVFEAYA